MQLSNTKYAAHILECAAIAKQVGEHLGLRDDAARQACFATVCIDAKGHGVFLEPIPKDTKTPVPQNGNDMAKDEAAAQKADDQIKDIFPNPTPEQADGARRSALLEGVHNAVGLLNKAGHVPPVTPKSLNEIIKTDLKIEGGLGVLQPDDLEFLIKKLATTLDTLKHNKKALEAEAPF